MGLIGGSLLRNCSIYIKSRTHTPLSALGFCMRYTACPLLPPSLSHAPPTLSLPLSPPLFLSLTTAHLSHPLSIFVSVAPLSLPLSCRYPSTLLSYVAAPPSLSLAPPVPPSLSRVRATDGGRRSPRESPMPCSGPATSTEAGHRTQHMSPETAVDQQHVHGQIWP